MYGLLALIGILLVGFIFCRQIRNRNMDDNDAIFFLLMVVVGILVGGHILYGITNIGNFHKFTEVKGIKEFFNVFGFLFGGSVFYGGLIGGIIAGAIVIKAKKLDGKVYMDLCALAAPLFHGIARIGCFLGGCCYGIESSFGFIAHGNTLTAIGEVRRFPVQLLESACNFLLVLLFWYLLKKKVLQGRLFYLYLSLYAVIRFFDEFLRGDEIRGFVLGLSTSQFISILIEIAALLCLFVLPKLRSKKTSQA